MSEQVEVKAVLKGLRISPRKVGVVASLVRRRTVADALVILTNTQRKASAPLIKLINSAVANAKHNNGLDTKDLKIKTIMVTEAPSMPTRYKFVGAGRRAKPRPMTKRSSHVTVVLVGEKPATKAPAKPKAATKPATKPAKVTTSKKESKK